MNFSVIFGLILPFFKVLGLWWTWIKFFRHGSDTKVVALYVMSMIGKFQQNRPTLIFLSRRNVTEIAIINFFHLSTPIGVGKCQKRIWHKNTPSCTLSFIKLLSNVRSLCDR